MLELTSLESAVTVERIFSAEVTEVPNQRSMVCFSSRSPAKPSAWMARTTVASEVWSRRRSPSPYAPAPPRGFR
jgi:hypothetical protein